MGRLLSIVFGVVTLIPLHSLARSLMGPVAANRTVWLAAFWPILVLHSVEVLNMAAYVFFVTVFLDQGWKTLQSEVSEPRGHAVLATLALLAGYWTRPEAMALWVFFLCALIVRGVRRRGRLGSWAVPVEVILIFLVGISPYVFFLHWQTGQWTPSRYLTNITAHTPAQPERQLPHQVENETVSSQYLLTRLAEHADEIAVKYKRNLSRLLSIWFPQVFEPTQVSFAWLCLLVLGWWSFWKQEMLGGWLWLFGTSLVSISVVALHGGNSRYLLPVIPAILIWLGHSLHLIEKVDKRVMAKLHGKFPRLPSRTFPLLTITACLAMAPYACQPVLNPVLGGWPYYPIEYKRAGYDVRAFWAEDNSALIARKPQVGFYAGLPVRSPSEWTIEGIEKAIPQEITTDYLVIDERETLALYPELGSFLEGGPPEGWRIVYEDIESPRIRVLARQD